MVPAGVEKLATFCTQSLIFGWINSPTSRIWKINLIAWSAVLADMHTVWHLERGIVWRNACLDIWITHLQNFLVVRWWRAKRDSLCLVVRSRHIAATVEVLQAVQNFVEVGLCCHPTRISDTVATNVQSSEKKIRLSSASGGWHGVCRVFTEDTKAPSKDGAGAFQHLAHFEEFRLWPRNLQWKLHVSAILRYQKNPKAIWRWHNLSIMPSATAPRGCSPCRPSARHDPSIPMSCRFWRWRQFKVVWRALSDSFPKHGKPWKGARRQSMLQAADLMKFGDVQSLTLAKIRLLRLQVIASMVGTQLGHVLISSSEPVLSPGSVQSWAPTPEGIEPSGCGDAVKNWSWKSSWSATERARATDPSRARLTVSSCKQFKQMRS